MAGTGGRRKVDTPALIGIILVAVALFLVLGAYVWSSRIIARISSRNLTSLREIRKELRDGDKDS
jgi:phosphate/sulfate permease